MCYQTKVAFWIKMNWTFFYWTVFYTERNNLLSNLTGVLEKQPATMTEENLTRALLMGESNDNPLK